MNPNKCTATMFTSPPNSIVPTTGRNDDGMEPISLTKFQDKEGGTWRVFPASAKSLRTTNPIRAIVDPIVSSTKSGEQRGDGLDPISLALGDPTAAGNLPPCKDAIDSIMEAVQSNNHAAGYVNACGTTSARQAIADFHSTPGAPVTSDNVIVASGCSGALELALTALLDPGTVLLVPKPGFPLYQVIAESHGASVAHYTLHGNHWECDLEDMEQLVSKYRENVRGILINNPSNPTGSVFSKSHLESLIQFAQRHRLLIVADEIYGSLTFGSHKFHPMAMIAANLGRHVPVVTTSGLGKQYLLPGWRVGWIIFHDNIHGSLQSVEAGAKRLSQVVLGACHLVQSIVPTLLSPTSTSIQQFKRKLCRQIEHQAYLLCDRLQQCNGLLVIEPQGTFYAMIRIDCSRFDGFIQNDIDFSKLLLQEENVFVLPGSAFAFKNAFRIVFCANDSILEEAAHRIERFCLRHKTADQRI